MNEVLNAIKNRRSVRKYKPEQITENELQLILEAGIYAPTAHNEQPWHFTVIQNRELIDEISEKAKKRMIESDHRWAREMGANPAFHLMYHAPTLIIVSGRKSAMAPMADCGAAMQNMLIAAESLDIGSVWIGLLRYYYEQEEELAKLNIPEGCKPIFGAAFGYKAEPNRPAPKKNYDVVQYIR